MASITVGTGSIGTRALKSSVRSAANGGGDQGLSSSWMIIRWDPAVSNRSSEVMRSWRLSAGGMMKVKAASGGVAKFKGTQMREKQLTEMIEKKVAEAKEVCEGDETSDECKVAWDEVEEVSQAKADLRLKLEEQKDPLESFCQDHPETDECRLYED